MRVKGYDLRMIGYNNRGQLTVPKAFFMPDGNLGGKIQADALTGRVWGYLFENRTPLRGGPLAGTRLDAKKVDLTAWAQGLVATEDMADDEPKLPVGVFALGPKHYADDMELARPQNAAILAAAYPDERGLYIAGVVHPEALKHRSLGELAGAINATAFSIEEDPVAASAMGVRRDRSRTGIVMRRIAGAVAVNLPGFPIASLAAAAVDGAGEPVDVEVDFESLIVEAVRAAAAEGVRAGVEAERRRAEAVAAAAGLPDIGRLE